MALLKLLKKAEVRHDERRPPEKKSHGGGGHDESNWLVSYADMMTLLCGFFIILFSLSKMDEPQYEKVKEAVAKEFGGKYQKPNEDLAKFITQVLQEAGIEKETMVQYDSRGLALTFQSTVFFDTLSADVKPEGKVILDRLITSLSERQTKDNKEYKVVVEGHTDSRPILSGTFPSNWELSGARASRVVRLFIEKQFNPQLLTAIGYADTHPEIEARQLDGSLDETSLAKNRRVVLRILDPKMDSIPLPDKTSPSQPEHRAPASAPAAPANSAH